MNLLKLFKYIRNLTLGEKYLIFKNLQEEIRINEPFLIDIYETANTFDRVKNLVLMKKEFALEEILRLIPFIDNENIMIKQVYLKILPVLFSYVSLYDIRITETFQIIEILQIHSVFTYDQKLFSQWFALFDKRRNSKKHFSYKDEYYIRDLPVPDSVGMESNYFREDLLHKHIGYTSVSLVRAFHRWLRLHRLHKYLYFFVNLSYEEVLQINDSNIRLFEEKVNLHKITIGAKNKILREIEVLRGRRKCLEGIIQENYTNYISIETAVREIKRILRTPICLNDIDLFQERLPSLLVMAMKKVFEVVLMHIGKNEDIIPIYGLLISVLKEAWNYNIFQPNEKENFNEWRQQIIYKINENSKKLQTIPIKERKLSMDTVQNIGINSETLQGETHNPYYHLENVANHIFQYLDI